MLLRYRYQGKIATCKVELSKMDRTKKFMDQVAKEISIPKDQLRFLFKGKIFDQKNNYRLVDYRCENDCLVEVWPCGPQAQQKVEDKPKSAKKEEASPEPEDKENSGSNGAKKKAATSPAKCDEEPKMEEIDPDAPTTSNGDPSADGAPIKLEDIFKGDIKELGLPEGDDGAGEQKKCKRCEKQPSRICKECNCNECGKDENDDQTLMCDECEYFYHMYCLDPPLETVPDGDWYCHVCKNDENLVVKEGQLLKASKRTAMSDKSTSKRDWGKGFATAGRSKVCSKVPANFRGTIPGTEVGMAWMYRIQVSEEGIHRPHVCGIAGSEKDGGCVSIVLSGGYEDDEDDGDTFLYTGSGGRDLSGNKRTAEQSMDQELTRYNAAIAKTCAAPFDKKNGGEAKDWTKSKAIRVVRGWKLAKTNHGKFAPTEGFRYDGLYKVAWYKPVKGRTGHIIWQFFFKRDDPIPAPWTDAGRQHVEDNGYSIIYPPGYDHAKAAEKAAKKPKPKAKKGPQPKPAKGTKRTRGNPDGDEAKSEEEKEQSEEEEKEEEKPVEKMVAPIFKKAKFVFKVPDKFRKAAAADERHKKEWDEIFEKEYANKLEFVTAIEEGFDCKICMEVVYQPVSSVCAHIMCKTCLKRMFKADTKTCPMCRRNFEEDDKTELMKLDEPCQNALTTMMGEYFAGRE